MNDTIPMKDLLDKFKDGDMISLTRRYSNEKITKEDIEKSNNLLINNVIKPYYDNHIKDKKDFKEVYEDIYAEIDKLKHNPKVFDAKNASPFIVDHIGKSTKYDRKYYFIYASISTIYENNDNIDNLLKNCKKDPLEILPEDLRNSLIKYQYSYFNNVTISGGLMINYYFKFDANVKKYLLTFKDDYSFDINCLEDLAIYKKDKIIFSSCTHEEFNSLED